MVVGHTGFPLYSTYYFYERMYDRFLPIIDTAKRSWRLHLNYFAVLHELTNRSILIVVGTCSRPLIPK